MASKKLVDLQLLEAGDLSLSSLFYLEVSNASSGTTLESIKDFLIDNGVESTDNKDQPNGYAGLDSSGNLNVNRISVRTGTASALAAVTLDDGELALTTDTHQILAGDGSTVGGLSTAPYEDLQVFTNPPGGGSFTLNANSKSACLILDLRGESGGTPWGSLGITNISSLPVGYEIKIGMITDGSEVQYITLILEGLAAVIINSPEGVTPTNFGGGIYKKFAVYGSDINWSRITGPSF